MKDHHSTSVQSYNDPAKGSFGSKLHRQVTTSVLAALAVLLPGSLLAAPTTILIDASHEGAATVQVLQSENYNFYTGPEVNNSAIEYGGLVDLLGVDNVYNFPYPWQGQIADRDWWFTDPRAPDPTRASVFIVWIDHDYGDFYNGYYGPLFSGDLRVGYNQHKPGGYYGTRSYAQPIQVNWVTLYSDDNLVLKFKGFLPNAGQK
jgi:hypothetical protein